MYTGSDHDVGRKGVARRVVFDLMNGYQGKNHLLYVDNYTSPELLIDLLEAGVYCTDTVHTNHKYFPQELFPSNKSMAMGNHRFGRI